MSAHRPKVVDGRARKKNNWTESRVYSQAEIQPRAPRPLRGAPT